MSPAWLSAWFLGAALLAAAPPELAPGTLIPSVACLKEPTHTYALYLPSHYTPDRAWPVLVGFSPGGDGTEPVRLFQSLAESHGWIVVGSNVSRNGPLEPAMAAQEILWAEVNRRFKIDPKRAYTVGFSGGARAAMRLALHHPDHFAGVIAMGAFYPGEDIARGRNLAYVLTPGLMDFNYTEFMQAREDLRRRGWLAWCLPFDGGHEWAPPAVCARAVAFLELAGARRGLLPRGDETPFLSEAQKEAQAREAEGETLLALRVWQDIADLAPDPLRKEARSAIARLEKAPRTASERALEASYEKTRLHISSLRATNAWGPEMLKLMDQEATVKGPELRHLRRILADERAFLWAAASSAVEVKDYPNAAKILTILAHFSPGDPMPPYAAARALARAGNPDGAMASLAEAIGRGLKDPELLRKPPAFDTLRERPDFQRLLRGLESAPQ